MGISELVEKTGSLTNEQMREFWGNGFLVIENVFSESEIEILREASEASQIVAERLNRVDHDKRTVHQLGLTAKHPAFMNLAKSPKILDRVVSLIGPDIQLQHSKLASKPTSKGVGLLPWHQDFAYYPHTNTDLVAVTVMVDDSTRENGGVRMVKGSHKLGLLDHTINGVFVGECQETRHWADPSQVVDIRLKAGGLSIHHCLTLHGSPPNISGKPRRIIVVSYRADDAYQLADQVWVDTGLLMCGQRREVVRCDAGIVRLPKQIRYKENPFGNAWNQAGELAKQSYYA